MRIGQNPAKSVKTVVKPERITVAVLNYIPFLSGYYADMMDVLSTSLTSIRESADLPFDLMVFDNGSCEEVKDYLLAEQSAGAAKEIYSLISTIQQESQKAVHSMDEGIAQVEAGSRVVTEVGGTFEKIIESIQVLAGEIQSVATASEEISSAVENVAAAAEEETATMEVISSTTQNLANLAEELERLANRFKLA